MTKKYWIACKGQVYSPVWAPSKKEALRIFRKQFGWDRLPAGTECGLV